MATTPFQQAAQISGSGFEQKLQAIVGIGQSIKQSQVAKQQLAQRLQMQKELVDYRYDKKVEYFQETELPQQQAKAQIDQRKAVVDKMKEYVDEKKNTFTRSSGLGVFNPQFQYQYDEEGRLADVGIFIQGKGGDVTELTPQEYYTLGNKFEESVKVVEDLKEGLEKGWFPDEIEEDMRTREGYVPITSADAKGFVDIMTDPLVNELEKRDRLETFLSKYESPTPPIGSDESVSSGSVDNVATDNLGSLHGSFVDSVDTNGTFKFSVPESSGFLGFGETKAVDKSIQIQGMPVSFVESELEGLLEELGLEEFKNFKGNNDVASQIIRGETEGLDDEAENLASMVNDLFDKGELMKEQVTNLLQMYRRLEPALNVARNKYDSPAVRTNPKDNIYIDLYAETNQGLFTTQQRTALDNLMIKYNQ